MAAASSIGVAFGDRAEGFFRAGVFVAFFAASVTGVGLLAVFFDAVFFVRSDFDLSLAFFRVVFPAFFGFDSAVTPSAAGFFDFAFFLEVFFFALRFFPAAAFFKSSNDPRIHSV